MMRAFVIGKVWPEPTSSAAGTRTCDILRCLQKANWELHFACAAKRNENSADLAKAFRCQTHQIELNRSSFEDWIHALQPDIVIFDRYMTEEQFSWRVYQTFPEALLVIDTSDLHFLREARRESLARGKPEDFYNATAVREIASIFRTDLSLIISEYEMQLLESQFPIPSSQCAYFPLFVEPSESSPLSFDERAHFVMIGGYLHEPNRDAIRHCREKIWPIIRKAIPNAELHAYGSYAKQAILQLNKKDIGFLIKGRADDAIQTLKQYRVSLAPLRFGAGLKGKMIDSMVAGTPCAVSPIAIEGICGDLPWGCHAESSPEAFANVAIQLYQNKATWQQAQKYGYDIISQRFAASHWQPKLIELLETAYHNRHENRAKNFIGKMLRHHQHRSHEYLSRWIEAKSKLSED